MPPPAARPESVPPPTVGLADVAADAGPGPDVRVKPARPTPSGGGPDRRTGLREREAVRVFALASDHHRHGRLDDAVRGYTRALALNPLLADAYNNMGVALRAQDKLDAAVACYRRSLALKPNSAGVYSNMGNALRDAGKLDAAAACHTQAVRLAPHSPEAVYNLGLVLRDMGETEKALQCFEKALSIRSDYVDCRWDRALSLLHKGDYENGFVEYEWRWKVDRSPPRGYRQPLWDGSELEGKTILVHQEQGFGDMIQFARYLPMVKDRGGTVVVEAQSELVRLLATVKGVDKVVIKGAPLPPFDVYAPMMTLPRIFDTTLDTVPAEVPYMSPPELHAVALPAVLGGQKKVGISWAGKPTHKNDGNRSCALSHFLELTGLPGHTFYSMQKWEASADLLAHSCEALVMDVGARLEDFADTAAVVQQLDLVITVDTALAHLAGALAKPVWVVLPFAGDWRWLDGSEISPWYPSMRLFRQRRPGDWDEVFRRVRGLLLEEAGETTTDDGAH